MHHPALATRPGGAPLSAHPPPEAREYDYGRTLGTYEILEKLNFRKVTRRSRNSLVGRLPFPPRNPLIAACGEGDFAVYFAKACNPPRLTINDISSKLLSHCHDRVRAAGFAGELILAPGDVTGYRPRDRHDFISLNYFLNLFPPRRQIGILAAIKPILTPEGILQVADFTLPKSPFMRPVFHCNWWLNVLLFWILAGNRPNRLGNPESHFLAAGWEVFEKASFVGGLFGSFLLRNALPETRMRPAGPGGSSAGAGRGFPSPP